MFRLPNFFDVNDESYCHEINLDTDSIILNHYGDTITPILEYTANSEVMYQGKQIGRFFLQNNNWIFDDGVTEIIGDSLDDPDGLLRFEKRISIMLLENGVIK